MDDQQFEQSLRLLQATHDFPCEFLFKVIGRADPDFVQRVVEVVRVCQQADAAPPYRTRETPSQRHVAITLEPRVESADQVLLIYEQIRRIEGVVLLL